MAARPFDSRVVGDTAQALDFITNILQASTEYSIVGTALDGTIVLWNEGACRLYGYPPEAVIGRMNVAELHAPEERAAGHPQAMRTAALADGKWEGTVLRQRRDGSSFTARVVLTPRRNASGEVTGFLLISKDISDEIRLTEELRANQRYTRSLFEANIDALMTTDPNGLITDVNQQMELLTGCRREALIGSLFKNYFTDPERAEAGIRQVLREGKVTDYELTAHRSDGSEVQVAYNASTFHDGRGGLQGVFAAARDITGQKALEQQLRDEQFYTRTLIESNIDALMTTDPRGIITDVNQQSEALTGAERDEMIGSPFRNYFTDPQRAEEGIRQVLRESKVTDYELTVRARGGSETVISYNATTFRHRDGRLRGVFVAARDVTEKKRAEELFRNLLESAPDPMVIVDHEGKIVLVNSQTERLLGYRREELLGQSVDLLVPVEARGRHPAHRQHFFANPTFRPMGIGMELRARRKDGLEFPIEISLSPLRTERGMLVSSALRDITERKRFEQTLQDKNVELEKASLAKDRFLASMSHELRTPLNAIIGFTGTLLMKLPGPLTADQDRQLHTIQASARHLLSLINDLLDLAKIESGKVEIARAPISCNGIVEEVANALRPLAEGKGLGFSLVLPPDDVVLLTDRRALSQIIINLTNNAIKYTEQGQVTLSLGQRREAERRLTEIVVADTGIGIRQDDQARLFQAFTQLDSSSTRRYEGTGLGLHLSQKLADLLGGRITFNSEYGRGSTFVLTFPEE